MSGTAAVDAMNETVSKAIEHLELHQLKKLVERAKAGAELNRADLQLLNRLSIKLDSAKAQSEAQKCEMNSKQQQNNKKRKRGRPANPRLLADKAERQALEEICERQARGEKLTGADYAFLEKMKLATAPEKLKASNILQFPEQNETWAQRLARLKEQAIVAIEYGVVNESGNARAAFAKMALELVNQTIAPDIETVHVRFDPIGEEEDKEETA